MLIASGILTTLMLQSAYQADAPTLTFPLIEITAPLTAATIGITLFGEEISLGGWRAVTVVAALALMVGGIVLSGVGGVTLISGLILTLAGSAQDRTENGRRLQTVGGIMLGGSALAIGAGIPMAVVGGKKVPRDDLPQPVARAAPVLRAREI